MRRLALPLVALAALVLPVAGHAEARILWPGVTYERGVQLTAHGPVAISILRGPRPTGATTLQPLLSNETLLGRETLSAMERRLAATATTAGVNGDFFTTATGRPSGVLMRDGQLVAQPRSTRSSAGITSDGTLDVRRIAFFGSWQGGGPRRPLTRLNDAPDPGGSALYTDAYGPATPAVPGVAATVVLFPFPAPVPGADLVATVGAVAATGAAVAIPPGGAVLVASGAQAAAVTDEAIVGESLTVRLQLRPDWPGVVAAIGGGPQIVRGGTPVFSAGEAFTSLQLTPRAPRTAVGQTADGRILLVAVDGRQPGLSVGLTNFELAQTMVRLGAVTAMAMDSGGSTTMAFDGTVLNNPSDGKERAISTALVLAYDGVFVPEVPARVSPNGDGVADDPRLAVRVVRPSSVTTRLVGPDGTITEASAAREPGTVAVPFPPAAPQPASTQDAPVVGAWRLEAVAVDDLGRTTTMTRSFVVDDTLGFLRVARRYVLRAGAKPLPVSFRLAREARVALRVETPSGVLVRALPAASLSPGDRSLAWDGRDRKGRAVTAGRYVVRVTATGPVGRSDLTASVDVRVVAATGR